MAWDETARTYDTVAGSYLERFEHELAAKPFDRALLDRFAAAVGDPVVEIGTGPGQVGAYVGQHGRRVIGLDLSFNMAKLASDRLDASVAADLRHLPIASGRVGAVVAFYSIIHVPRSELAPALAELARVLRSGGRLLVSAHEGSEEVHLEEFLGAAVPLSVSFFSLDELVAAAVRAGLEVVDAQRRDPYPQEHQSFRLYLEATRPTPPVLRATQ